jgi:hypothetical protein
MSNSVSTDSWLYCSYFIVMCAACSVFHASKLVRSFAILQLQHRHSRYEYSKELL